MGRSLIALGLMALCIIGKLLFTVFQKESIHMSSSTPCVTELKFNVDGSAKGKPRQVRVGGYSATVLVPFLPYFLSIWVI